MVPLSIVGIGAVGGFGNGWQRLVSNLEKRESQISFEDPPQASISGAPPQLTADTKDLGRFVDTKTLRRLNHYSRMALLAAYLAIEDAGACGRLPRCTGVVLASGFGAGRSGFHFLDSVIDGGDPLASPGHFAASLHASAAAGITANLGISGPMLTVSQFEHSFPSALLTAGVWLEQRRVDAVLVGGVDELCGVREYCLRRCRRKRGSPYSGAGEAVPRFSSPIGEGAAVFVVTRRQGGPEKYAAITRVAIGTGLAEECQEKMDAAVFAGADSEEELLSLYAPLLHLSMRLKIYTPSYGSLPVGPAFDTAIAALSLKRGRFFPTPVQSKDPGGNVVSAAFEDSAHGLIRCVKADRSRRWAAIDLES